MLIHRLALAAAATFVALGAAIIMGGALLPRTHSATSEIVIDRKPEEIWSVVRDFQSLPAWWPEVQESTRVEASVSGERWRQVVDGSEMLIDVVEERPPGLLVTRIVEEGNAVFGGRWVYAVTPADAGTRVRVTEEGWIGPWPFRTVIWVAGYHRSLDGYLRSLGLRFGQQLTPSHVEPAPALTQ